MCKPNKKSKEKCPAGWIYIIGSIYEKNVLPCRDSRADTPECYLPKPTLSPIITTSKTFLAKLLYLKKRPFLNNYILYLHTPTLLVLICKQITDERKILRIWSVDFDKHIDIF